MTATQEAILTLVLEQDPVLLFAELASRLSARYPDQTAAVCQSTLKALGEPANEQPIFNNGPGRYLRAAEAAVRIALGNHTLAPEVQKGLTVQTAIWFLGFAAGFAGYPDWMQEEQSREFAAILSYQNSSGAGGKGE